MAKGYNAPAEVRELEKQINDFTYRNGLDVKTVFQDLLRYIVHGFSLPDTPPLSDWRYNKEQTKVFYDMFATWIQIMSQQIKRHGWYDAFGDLFMALTSQSGQQQKGQFFTPAHITDLMSKITMGKQESDAKILSVCDPTAGSGRTLLAAKADTAKLSGRMGHRLHLLPDVRVQLSDKWLCGRGGLHRLTPDG